MGEFNFTEAQKHELEWQKGYIATELPHLYSEWINSKKDLHPLDDWFEGDVPEDFHTHLIGKTAIEIGCGSCPRLKDSFGLGRRIVIDPLADDYKSTQQGLWGGSFFDGLEIVSKPAEDFVDDLEGAVDGFILCRNALDHSQDPFVILDNIGKYATKGCYLFFWSDIWHHLGTDEGHHNITKDKGVIMDAIRYMGFDLLNTIPSQHEFSENYIEFGGAFIKTS